MSRLRPDPRRAERKRQQSLQAGTLFLILAGFAGVMVLVRWDSQQNGGSESPLPPAPSTNAAASSATASGPTNLDSAVPTKTTPPATNSGPAQ